MGAPVVSKDPQYVFNHCAKYLARDNTDTRHSFFGNYDGQRRGAISEAWRFPIVDAHDGDEPDADNWNDVTFVYMPDRGAAHPVDVALICTAHALHDPIPLLRIGDSLYWSRTLKVRKGRRERYLLLVDGATQLDLINPQTETLTNGDVWSSFFTWAYNQPIVFERWELAILDRLARHILPFNTPDAETFLKLHANEGNSAHLYRLDVSVGAANFIDKLVAREERHQLYAYKTCLEMIDRILRKRYIGRDPEFVNESAFVRLYDEMAEGSPALFADGWDTQRYNDPSHFLTVLRRHAVTGAFAHPKYGGNAGSMAWAYLSERYRRPDGSTLLDWRQAIEKPLGTSDEYLG